jgi:8-oxo-dGTP diphosphatase
MARQHIPCDPSSRLRAGDIHRASEHPTAPHVHTAPVTTRPRKLVVAGLIRDAQGRILLTKRRPDQALPNFWEFPGGKLEPGESPTAALHRELREEIGVTVELGAVWEALFHAYPDFDLLMLVYPCRIVEGEPRPLEVAAAEWTTVDELSTYDILPADLPLVERLREEAVARAAL